ncbi:twin-arginine translocation signal domain-containing protein [Candidatus Latescibacterota bacterium]
MMKRRDFITKCGAGAALMGTTGCSVMGSREQKNAIQKKKASHSFEVTHPKPSGGSMIMSELGTTGIKVSKFGYGAHIPGELRKFENERKKMILEAYDLGVNMFDIYDHGSA